MTTDSFSKAWEVGRNNGWRLFFGWCALFIFYKGVVYIVSTFNPEGYFAVLFDLFILAIIFLWTAVLSGYLSFSYRQLNPEVNLEAEKESA